MFIPGQIIALFTFPGVIVHEWSHATMCRLREIPVHEICYFQFGDPSGYVSHDTPTDFWNTFLISFAPLLFGPVVAFWPGVICFLSYTTGGTRIGGIYIDVMLLWFVGSVLFHTFPSSDDAKIVWNACTKEVRKKHPLTLVAFPLAAAVYLISEFRPYSFIVILVVFGFFV
jgi:hypothetical protein